MVVAILMLAVSGTLLLIGRRALDRDLTARQEESGAITLASRA
jgi:hypothetical protein